MQPLPDAGCLPIPHSPPTGRAAATTQLLREQAPRAARSKHEDDPTERGAVGDTRATTPQFQRLLRLLWQQRFNSFPQGVRDKRCSVHDP